MILEGFEIENWSCIKHVSISDLPPTGVIVLHGPNGTGKSSILAALRAALMDYPATSAKRDLKRWFPKNSGEKSKVSVTFRVQGASWRITKQFGSMESKLESRTPMGTWKTEQATAADAHDQTLALIGGKRSDAGLQQLLWLTQAEFHLPDPKAFDSDVQSQLRGILGILQTPLDDRFLGRVKTEWSRWFGARSKPGEKPKLKNDCSLGKALAAMEQSRTDLTKIETEFRDFETMTQRSTYLEVLARGLRQNLQASNCLCNELQGEYERCLKRLEAHRNAGERVATAQKELDKALDRRQTRADTEARTQEAERTAGSARQDAEEKTRLLGLAEQELRAHRQELQKNSGVQRARQIMRDEVSVRIERLNLTEQVESARGNLRRAEELTRDLDTLQRQARENPAPDAGKLRALTKNRTTAAGLRADLDAAAITLRLSPDAGAAPPLLVIDSAAPEQPASTADGPAIERPIRRNAEITLPGWGRLELSRGSDARSLDEIEAELQILDRSFSDTIAPFGIPAGDPTALDRLRGLFADQLARDPEVQRLTEEVSRLAPKGVDHLRQEVARLENLLLAGDVAFQPVTAGMDLPSTAQDLKRLDEGLKSESDVNLVAIVTAEKKIEQLEREIDVTPSADSTRKDPKGRNRDETLGLRQQEAAAKERTAALAATSVVLRGELDRLLTAEQIEQEVCDAETALANTKDELDAAQLSESEQTVKDRLDSAKDARKAIDDQLREAERELNQHKGELRRSEGLHQKRAAAAARVEELALRTERETLEGEAFDRLYALFEESREKQLGTVMGPIHDRVLRWMRLLNIGGYRSIRFNDQFLPDALLAQDGASELAFGEESTGTIEQMALMVRLALGATLSKAAEPVVAMLDDPLTHSDVVRLHQMRAVLRSAALGDAVANPAAGPLQIFVFTCHPEWFAIDGAKVIDLGKPEVLRRSSF